MPSMRRRTPRAGRAVSRRRREGSSSTRRPCSSTVTRRCPISSTPRPRRRRLRSGTARFPLLLTCAKPTLFLQSQNRALASLRKRSMSPEVELHPEAARDRRDIPGRLGVDHDAARQRARLRPLQRELSILASWLASMAGGRVVPSSMRRAMTLSARSAPTTIC